MKKEEGGRVKEIRRKGEPLTANRIPQGAMKRGA